MVWLISIGTVEIPRGPIRAHKSYRHTALVENNLRRDVIVGIALLRKRFMTESEVFSSACLATLLPSVLILLYTLHVYWVNLAGYEPGRHIVTPSDHPGHYSLDNLLNFDGIETKPLCL